MASSCHGIHIVQSPNNLLGRPIGSEALRRQETVNRVEVKYIRFFEFGLNGGLKGVSKNGYWSSKACRFDNESVQGCRCCMAGGQKRFRPETPLDGKNMRGGEPSSVPRVGQDLGNFARSPGLREANVSNREGHMTTLLSAGTNPAASGPNYREFS